MNATFDGRLNEDKLKSLRDKWKGKFILKGVANEVDAEVAMKVGCDAIICSNHGGRQLDHGESSIKPMSRIAKKFGDKIEIIMDSGIRSAPDIVSSIANGAKFTFLGRTFMYGVGALGDEGGNHTISMLKASFN